MKTSTLSYLLSRLGQSHAINTHFHIPPSAVSPRRPRAAAPSGVSGGSCRYDEKCPHSIRHAGFTSAVGLVWNNKPAAFWYGSRKAGQTAQTLTSAKNTHTYVFYTHEERRLVFTWSGWSQLFNFLFFFSPSALRTQTIVLIELHCSLEPDNCSDLCFKDTY